jgi:protein-disulfide isomerase
MERNQGTDGRRDLRRALDVAVSVAMLVACGVVVWGIATREPTQIVSNNSRPARGELAVPKEPLTLTNLALKGSATAPIAMIVFSDFECPYCVKFANEIMPELVTRYVDTGKLLVGFRHLPIESIHRQARAAAEISVCAESVGRFWAVHDEFFRPPAAKEGADFNVRARRAGLAKADLARCLETGRPRRWVDDDLELASSLQIRSTPSFLLGVLGTDGLKVQKAIRGARPAEEFDKAINEMSVKAR